MAGRRQRRRRREAKPPATGGPALNRSDAVMLIIAADRLDEHAACLRSAGDCGTIQLAGDLRIRALEVDPSITEAPIDAVWVRAIKELFAQAGYETPGARSHYVRRLIGHPVNALSDLTVREAREVVRSLDPENEESK